MSTFEQQKVTTADILAQHGTIDGIPIADWIRRVNQGARPLGSGVIDLPHKLAEYLQASSREKKPHNDSPRRLITDKSVK